MSAKVTDRKGRWRNLTIAFRVSPQENEQINECYSHKILTLDGYTKLSLDSYSTCRCIQL